MPKAKANSSTVISAVAKIYRDTNSKQESFLVKIILDEAFAWLTYAELESKLQDEVELRTNSISDALGKRKSRGLNLNIRLDKTPESAILKDGRTVLDMDNVHIIDWKIAE